MQIRTRNKAQLAVFKALSELLATKAPLTTVASGLSMSTAYDEASFCRCYFLNASAIVFKHFLSPVFSAS